MTELRLDYDGAVPRDFWRRLQVIVRHQKWHVQLVTQRRTKNGWHVVVRVREVVHPLVVVASQALLCSDWKRENFNLWRARFLGDVPREWQQAKRWNALYSSHTHLSRVS
jgi:hypothetical protein